MELKFCKETDSEGHCRWYIDFPEWEGPKDDLEMVAGADVMLDELSMDKSEVDVDVTIEPMSGADLKLVFDEPYAEGGNYIVHCYNDIHKELDGKGVWLCYVTKYVFGYLPVTLYLKTLNF